MLFRSPNESWIGKSVRLVGPLTQPINRNTAGKVEAVGSFGLTVRTIAGSLVDVEEHAVYELSGFEVRGMPEELPDLRLMTDSEKALGSAACGGAPKLLTSGALLDDAQMMAGWHEIIFRANARQPGSLPSKNVAVVPVRTGQMLLDQFQSAPGSVLCAELISAFRQICLWSLVLRPYWRGLFATRLPSTGLCCCASEALTALLGR